MPKVPHVAALAPLVWLFLALTSSAVGSSHCAELQRYWQEGRCDIGFGRFRPLDWRLSRLQEAGIEGSGLFPGRRHLVRDATELAAVAPEVRPGDRIVLADGVWQDQTLRLAVSGEERAPIIIMPQTSGGVELRGSSSLGVSGAHVIVHGLAFRAGTASGEHFVVFRLGLGKDRPCDHCVADRIVVEGYRAAPDTYFNYAVFLGKGITLANSRFADKTNPGTTAIFDLPKVGAECPQGREDTIDCHQRAHIYRNRFDTIARPDPGGPDRGQYKFIQLGSSDVSTRSSYSIIEDNVFENATGCNETISLKASDLIVRNNRFVANRGTLNLRSANRVLIEGNLFDGSGIDSMGGVRIEGRGHWVVNNVFRRLVRPASPYYWPIAIHDGSQEELTDGYEDYAQVRDVVIAGNRFEQSSMPAIGLGVYPNAKRPYHPVGVVIADNVFDGRGTETPVHEFTPLRAGSGTTVINNTVSDLRGVVR